MRAHKHMAPCVSAPQHNRPQVRTARTGGQLVTDGAHEVGLASTRQPEDQQVVTTIDEPSLAEPRQRPSDLGVEMAEVE